MRLRQTDILVCCLLSSASLAAGCGGGNNMDAGPTPVGNVVMRDSNSYTSVSTLTLPVVQTQSGADLQVCWGEMTKDILCHNVSPTADIDNVAFLQIPGRTKEQVQQKLAKGTLTQNEVIYREFHTTGSSTCANLSSFAYGTQLMPATDYVTSTSKTYMLLFATGTTPGTGARTMMFLDPVASSTTTMVNAPADGCSILDFTADLHTPSPLSIPMNGPWDVDWSLLTKDSMNNDVDFQLIDKLMVGYYEGKTVAQLEAMFKDIDMIATTLWDVPITGGQTHMDLAMAKTAGGAAFPGFTGTSTGVYAVALLCSECQVPAPVALSILQPAP